MNITLTEITDDQLCVSFKIPNPNPNPNPNWIQIQECQIWKVESFPTVQCFLNYVLMPVVLMPTVKKRKRKLFHKKTQHILWWPEQGTIKSDILYQIFCIICSLCVILLIYIAYITSPPGHQTLNRAHLVLPTTS